MNRFLRFFAKGEDRSLLTDQKEIDRLYRRNRMAIMLSISVGYGIAYTCRLGLSVVKKPLLDGGIFSAEDLGVIGSALLYGYAVGKLVNGFLADHANMKRFLSTGILLSALINLLMGRTELLWIWVVLWGLNGWFQGFGAPAGIVSLSNWFSNRERGRFYGIWSTGHSIGEGLTFVGSGTLVGLFGWQAGFWGPGAVCVLVAVLVYFYLQEAKGFSIVKAGTMLGISTVCGIIGAIAYGFISDKLFSARRPPVNLIFGLLELLALSLIFFGPAGNTFILGIAFACYGFSLNGLVAALGGLFAVDISPKKAAGAAIGFIGIFSYIGAATQDLISGYLLIAVPPLSMGYVIMISVLPSFSGSVPLCYL
jgi:sugar phosphate permease